MKEKKNTIVQNKLFLNIHVDFNDIFKEYK